MRWLKKQALLLRAMIRKIGLIRNPIPIREWRIQEVEGGMYLFFDPTREKIYIYPLTSPDGNPKIGGNGSVSALTEAEAEPHQMYLLLGRNHGSKTI